jgi:hypothetical protein
MTIHIFLSKRGSTTFLGPSARSIEDVRHAVRKQKKEKEEISHFDTTANRS